MDIAFRFKFSNFEVRVKVCFHCRGICSNQPDDPVQSRLEPFFKPLARSYRKICKKVNKDREFYGLRDFYR